MNNKELSRPWAQEIPKHAGDARDDLESMRNECSRQQRKRRDLAFTEAHNFIANAQNQGGLHAPISESFCRHPRRRAANLPSARVDIEVQTGKAFI